MAAIPASTEAGLNLGGALWIVGVAALVALAVYVLQRRRTGQQPVTTAIAILAGAAVLTLVLGLAGLIVGAVIFLLFELSSLAS